MSNGSAFFLPPEKAQGLANYPHARILPTNPASRTIHVSGTSSRRGDGTWDGVTEHADGTWTLDIRQQTAAVLRNIDTVIRGATDGKGSIKNVVDATVFLTDLTGSYQGMNEEWNKVWPNREDAPARTTIGVKELPNPRLLVEIKCTAICEW
ncbi:Endoribonuclease L-PSP/chorismate mutase-like protein [Aspergillus pseudonomiae]|uniref:Endoribonuclease L-PSP/chorismate mutase-like protein n=1 Tax=Aspergillus pseudonomiae TaxID=1506151 RepID=A0A5N7D782_9EURO|nr:Endoribonuclease L-PSP/chorismate mutase-like protein [Aspergillus pseudonomiae]KAE8402139.1 Endoribonuclease L-PSP/chorismate mutase-like protein [Aspergillus pseudonomiae]